MSSPAFSPHLTVDVFATDAQAAAAAAQAAAVTLRDCIARQGQARIMVGTGNSQREMIRVLAGLPGIDWSRVDAFHLDEYVGIGENGHIAFNDPHVADFNDVATVKRVALDDACRRQQVGEGHFPTLDAVPREAITVTCSGLFRAARWICCVPDRRKAQAVKGSLEDPVSTTCPGSLIRRHPSAGLYLDAESASRLTSTFSESYCRVHYARGTAAAAH